MHTAEPLLPDPSPFEVVLHYRRKQTDELKKLPGIMVVILNTAFTEDKSPCNGLSLCMLVSSIVIEINILLIDHILNHFVRHSVQNYDFICCFVWV
jgi:hypothetical protein